MQSENAISVSSRPAIGLSDRSFIPGRHVYRPMTAFPQRAAESCSIYGAFDVTGLVEGGCGVGGSGGRGDSGHGRGDISARGSSGVVGGLVMAAAAVRAWPILM